MKLCWNCSTYLKVFNACHGETEYFDNILLLQLSIDKENELVFLKTVVNLFKKLLFFSFILWDGNETTRINFKQHDSVRKLWSQLLWSCWSESKSRASGTGKNLVNFRNLFRLYGRGMFDRCIWSWFIIKVIYQNVSKSSVEFQLTEVDNHSVLNPCCRNRS